MLHKIVNSLIVRIEIIEQKNPVNTIILHHAYGTLFPYVYDANKKKLVSPVCLQKKLLWEPWGKKTHQKNIS